MNKITYNILSTIGWIWFYIKKPFKIFLKLNWKAQLILIIIFLTIFDGIRFLLFDIIMWVIRK